MSCCLLLFLAPSLLLQDVFAFAQEFGHVCVCVCTVRAALYVWVLYAAVSSVHACLMQNRTGLNSGDKVQVQSESQQRKRPGGKLERVCCDRHVYLLVSLEATLETL